MRRGSKRLKKGDPPREVVERRKEVATARPRDRKYVEARRQAEIAARNKLSPGGKKVEEKHDLAFSKKEPLTSHRLRKIRRNERSSGSLCLAAARDTKNAPGNKTRDESAREMKVESPRPEANRSRSEAETIGETSRFPAACQALQFTLYIL